MKLAREWLGPCVEIAVPKLVDQVAEHIEIELRAEYLRGAEEMRERAALLVDYLEWGDAGKIRRLPLSPSAPQSEGREP